MNEMFFIKFFLNLFDIKSDKICEHITNFFAFKIASVRYKILKYNEL